MVHRKLALPNPAETAKVLIWIVISVESLTSHPLISFNFRDPESLATVSQRILPAIDRLVLCNDEIATTLPGIECLILLSRYHCNLARFRKAWHLCRRALDHCISLELGHLTRQADVRIDGTSSVVGVFQAACFLDRYLSLILGLPSGAHQEQLKAAETATQSAETSSPEAENFYSSMTSIMSQIIDRNQNASEDSQSLLLTLRIHQQMKHVNKDMNVRTWENDLRITNPHVPEPTERIEAYFLFHFIQTLLHLPSMMKCLGDGNKAEHQFSSETARRSARQALIAYIFLRVQLNLDPYLCTVFDFQAFTMAQVLTLHILSKEYEGSTITQTEQDLEEQNQRDWKYISSVTDVLHQASQNQQTQVAEQALIAMDLLRRAGGRAEAGDSSCTRSKSDGGDGCRARIIVPCLGEIGVTQGIKGIGCLCGGSCTNIVDSIRPEPSKLSGDRNTTTTSLLLKPRRRPTILWSLTTEIGMCFDKT